MEVDGFPKVSIFKLFFVRKFLEDLLNKDPKKRVDLFNLDFYEFYSNRLRAENP